MSQVSSLVRTLPMFRTAQTSTASKQMTDLHRSLGTPQGWITVQRGWSPPRCCCWRGERCGYPMMMVLTVHYPNIPFYSILFYKSSEGTSRSILRPRGSGDSASSVRRAWTWTSEDNALVKAAFGRSLKATDVLRRSSRGNIGLANNAQNRDKRIQLRLTGDPDGPD